MCQCLQINHDFLQQTNTSESILDSTTDQSTTSTKPSTIQIKHGLNANYTRKYGERVRFECEFEYTDTTRQINPNDLTLYWVKNYQELLHSKKGFVHIIRKNMTTMYVFFKAN
jgi:hypothetical protein